MPVEEIIKEIQKQDAIIDSAQIVKRGLYEQLKNAGSEDYDWISVNAASKILGVSVCTIYNKINSGKLHTRHIESSVRVRKSEVMAIDDKYEKKTCSK